MIDLSKTLEELNRRNLIDLASRQIRSLRRTLFDAQINYLDDESKLRVVTAGRRGGKTTVLATEALISAIEHPGTIVPVVELSRQSQAAKQYQMTLESLFKHISLDYKYDAIRGINYMPNGSRVELVTGSDMSEIDKLRGGKYRLVQIDEAQSFRPSVLGPAIENVIEPALMDYNGSLTLAGTPSISLNGEFYKASTGQTPGFSSHYWTAENNPHIPHFREWLDNLCLRRGWTTDHPTVQREYLAKWVVDDIGLCYPVTNERNVVEALPTDVDHWKYTLGVDVGFVDSTAFVIWAETNERKEAYCVRSYRKKGLTPSDVARETMALQQQFSFTNMVMDSGGIGKAYQEEISQRFHIYFDTAQKRDKAAAIQMMADEILSGRLLWVKATNQDYLEEMSLLPWDESHELPDPRFEDHLCDAGLYGFRKLTPTKRARERAEGVKERDTNESLLDKHFEKILNYRAPVTRKTWRDKLR